MNADKDNHPVSSGWKIDIGPVHSSIYMSLLKNAGSEERGSEGGLVLLSTMKALSCFRQICTHTRTPLRYLVSKHPKEHEV